MPLQGNLKEMSLANLIQVNCQEMRSARLTLSRRGQKGEVYFYDGQLVHASTGSHVGDDAVFELLTWDAGAFTLENDVHSPTRSIQARWSDLLLEGMKRLADWQAAESKTDGANPQTLARLTAVDGVIGAVVTAFDGVVLAADVPHTDGSNEAAVTVFVGAAASQIGETLQLGEFEQSTAFLPKHPIWILKQPDRYIGLLLDDHSSPALVANAAANALG